MLPAKIEQLAPTHARLNGNHDQRPKGGECARDRRRTKSASSSPSLKGRVRPRGTCGRRTSLTGLLGTQSPHSRLATSIAWLIVLSSRTIVAGATILGRSSRYAATSELVTLASVRCAIGQRTIEFIRAFSETVQRLVGVTSSR